MANRRRSALLLGACLAVGALIVIGLRGWTAGDASLAPQSRGEVSKGGENLTGEGRTFTFRTRLLPDAGRSAATDSVRIGLAMVTPDERAAYRAWLRGGREGAGPQRMDDLAAVVRWMDVDATRDADGRVLVGPVALPAADRYVLQARVGDGLRFYETAFARDDVPAEVRARVAAGLRVRAPRGIDGAAVLFRRVDGAADAPWQSLMRREAPALLDAYDERALPVRGETEFAPLPPGPLDVIAVVNGVETERRRVTLSAGRYAALDLDPDASELGAALATTLRLRLIERGSGAPVREATVVWGSPRGERRLRTDDRGHVRIDGIDPLQPLTLELLFTAPRSAARMPTFLVDALPTWPERMPLPLDLRDAPVVAGAIDTTVELQPLRWLIVDTPGIEIPRRPRMGDPFPVFVLQRRESGAWRESPAEIFRPVPGGIAVSLDRPGTVRVSALLSPWQVAASDAVDSTEGDARQRTRLVVDGGRTATLRLSAAGRPLARAPVQVVSPLRGVPPKTLTTDADGRLVLANVTVPMVWVDVLGFAQTAVRLTAAEIAVPMRREGD
jgi:hypothetical protein